MNNKIDISAWTIIKFILVVLGFVLVWFVRDILIMLFVVLIIVAALFPIIKSIEKFRVRRALAALLVYILVFLFLGVIIYAIIPPLVDQIKNLAVNLPFYINKISLLYEEFYHSAFTWQSILESISNQLGGLGQGFYSATLKIFGGVASFVTIIVLSFYLLLDADNINKSVLSWFSNDWKLILTNITKKIAIKMGGWLRGQVILSFSVGLADFIGLSIIGIPYALTLGVLAALVEIVPIVGPFIAGLAAILVAIATTSWIKGLIVLGLYILVQQLESHVLVPKIMGKSVGLSPVIIIIALLVGGKIASLTGAILAIPAAAAIAVVLDECRNIKKISKDN